MSRLTPALAGVIWGAGRLDRTKLAPVAALRATVAVAIALVAGELAGHVLVGVVASIGALSGGFASLQGSYRSRAGLVLAATLSLAVSAAVGGTVGHMEGPDIAVTAVWGLVAGLLVTFGTGALIVGLQAVVGLVVFSQFSFTPAEAVLQGAWVLCGGVLAALMVAVVWPLRRFPAERRSLGSAYQQLAERARAATAEMADLGDPLPIHTAGTVLRDPQPFARHRDLVAYQALVDLAERILLELAALGNSGWRIRAAVRGGDPDTAGTGAAVTGTGVPSFDGTGAAAPLPPGQASPLGTPVIHPAGRSAVYAVEVASGAAASILDELAAAIAAGRTPHGLRADLDTLVSAAAACRAVTAGPVLPDRWQQATLDEAARACEALAGQLRAAARLAAVPANGSALPEESVPETAAAVQNVALHGIEPMRGSALLRSGLGQLRANLSLSSEPARHALRLAAALIAAVALSHVFRAGHGYWLPLTVVIVLRADFVTTFTRGVARSVGTIAGAALVTLLIAGTRPDHGVLIALTLGFYWVAVTILQANYTAYSVFIASLVVTLLAFTGQPAPALAADRSLYTVVGAALALGIYAIWPTWERAVVPERLASLLETEAHYGAAVLDAWADPAHADTAALHQARVAARLARSNAEASVDRWLSEPARSSALLPEVAQGVVTAVRRYLRGVLSLHASLSADAPPCPEARRLGQQVVAVLGVAAHALREERPLTGPVPDLRTSQLQMATSVEAAIRHAPVGGLCTDVGHSATGPHAETGRALLLISETDAVVDAVDTLCHLLGPVPRGRATVGRPGDRHPGS